MSWIWPFPRLRFRLRYGYWCPHPYWRRGAEGRRDGWQMIDTGARQMRRCGACDWVEFR